MDDLNTRVKQFSQEIKPFLDKYNLRMGAIPDFPRYKKLPLEVELALEVLKKNEVVYTVAFQEGGQNASDKK